MSIQWGEVRISITNEQGEVFSIHQIGDVDEAQYALHELRPAYYPAPEIESAPEDMAGECMVDDLCTALLNFINAQGGKVLTSWSSERGR